MTDWIVKLYRKMNTTARRAAVLLLAFVIAMSTLHFMTFPATALTRKAGENDPGIVIGDETNTEGFDNASEGENTEVNPVNTETAPAEEGTTVIPEGEAPAPEDPTADVEPTPDSTEPTEPTVTPDGNEEAEVIVEPTATPEPTETPVAEEVEEEPEEGSDPTADIETAADWEKLFSDIEFTGVWADDLLAAAESQIGYQESTANFIRDEENIKRGYTRYGAWYGDAYAKWDSLFVMFNLYYAGITKLDFPYQADCEEWIDALKDAEMFHEVNTYVPNKGDLVFADVDEDGESDHVAIVKAVEKDEAGNPDKLIVIEGDTDNEVKESTYEFYNPLITGFAQLPENPLPVQEEAIAEEPEAEPVYATFEGKANNVVVTVQYEEGAFPEGTTMKVKPVWNPSVLGAINDTVTDKEVVKVQAVDIIFLNAEGKEIEPSKPIKVTMKSTSIPKQAEEAPVVVHVDDKLDTSVVEAEQAEEAEKPTEAVTFESDAFSVYAIVYTVDFAYALDGHVYTFSMEGGQSMKLSALVTALGIVDETKLADGKAFVAEVQKVEFTDPSLLRVRKDFFGSDWTLTSLAPFTSEEALTITMKNGDVLTLRVTDDQESSNLSDFLTKVTVSGAELENGNYVVEQGKIYGVTMTFKETANLQFANESELTYKLPEGITLPSATDTTIKIAVVSSGRTYEIPAHVTVDKAGNVKVKFDESSPNFSKLVSATNVSFRIAVDAMFDQTINKSEWGAKMDKDIVIDTSDHSDAFAEKSGVFDEATGKFTYTIKVRAQGNPQNVHVKDLITGNALIFNNDVQVTGNSSTYTNTPLPDGQKGFDYTFASMQDGEEITITYSASLDPAKAAAADVITADMTKNTVTVQKDGGDPHNAEYSHEINLKKPDKSDGTEAGVTADGDKLYNWTVEYNKTALVSAAGDTVSDKIKDSAQEYMKYYGPVTVKVYDHSGTLVDTRSFTPGSDSAWTYTIPSGDTTPYRYVFEYQTVVDQAKVDGSGKPMQLQNDSTGPGGSDDGKIDVGPKELTSIDKHVESANPQEVTWISHIHVPEGGLSTAVVTDTLPNMYSGNIGLDGNYTLYDFYKEGTLDIQGCLPGESYSVDSSDPSKVVITFYKDSDKTQPGLQGTTGGHEITVRLTTLVDQKWLQYGYEHPGDYRADHTNKININGGKDEEDTVTFSAPDLKKSGTIESGKYLYTLIVSGVTKEPLIIDDVFDTDKLQVAESMASDYRHFTIWGGNQYSQGDGATSVNYSDTSTGLQITADSLPKQSNGEFYSYYKIQYFLELKDGVDLDALAIENGGKYELKNEADWNGHKDDFSFETKYDFLNKELLKEATATNRQVQYKITFNPAKGELNGGKTIPMKDTLNENLSVDYTSIQIVTDPAGVEVPYSLSGDDNGRTIATYMIPDSTKVEITYNAMVVGEDSVNYKNTVEAHGEIETVDRTTNIHIEGEGVGAVANFKVLKVDGYDANKKLAGVKFKLYAADGRSLKKDEEVKELILETDENGQIFIDGNELEIFLAATKEESVTYYLEEVDPPEGYQSIAFPYQFTLVDDIAGVDYEHFVYFFNDSMQIKNWPLEGLVVGKKVVSDETADHEKFFNFRVSILNNDGTVNTNVNQKYGDMQFENGVAQLELKDKEQISAWDMPKGTKFKVEELDGDGYVISATINETSEELQGGNAVIGTTGENYTVVTFTNTKKREKVEIGVEKVWSPEIPDPSKNPSVTVELRRYAKITKGTIDLTLNDQFGAPVPGAIFQLYKDGEEQGSYTTNALGKIVVSGLEKGSYYLQETSAPEGYTMPDGVRTDTLTVNDVTTEQKLTATLYNEKLRTTGSVTVYLTRSDTGAPVSGAGFAVYLEGHEEVVNAGTTNETGQIKFDELRPGTYIVRQTSTASDLKLAADQQVTIGVEDKQVSFTNDLKPVYYTLTFRSSGDNLSKEYKFEKDTQVTFTFDNGNQYYNPYDGHELSGDVTGTIGPKAGPITFSVLMDSDKTVTISDTNNQNWGNIVEQSLQFSPEPAADTEAATAAFTRRSLRAAAPRMLAATNSTHDDAEPPAAPEGYAEDSEFTPISYTLSGDDWSYTFPEQDKTDENGNPYYYYVVETAHTPENYWIEKYEYEGGPYSENGVVKITNKEEPLLGSLQISKTGKVNGEDPTDVNKNYIDGEYSFTVAGKEGDPAEGNSVTVNITLTKGKATAAVKAGTSMPEAAEVTIDETGIVKVSGLPAGVYTVTENLTAEQKEKGIALLSSDNTEVTVVAGDIAGVGTASFVNNNELTNLKVIKEWADGQTEITEIGYTVYRIPKVLNEDGDVTEEFDPEEIDVTKYGATGKLKADSNPAWTEELNNLPKTGTHTPESGNSIDVVYKYYVSEESIPGYRPYTRGKDSEDGKTFEVTITNTPNGDFYSETDVSVTKKWFDQVGEPADDAHKNDTVTFQVTQKKYEVKQGTNKLYPVRIILYDEDGTVSEQSRVVFVQSGATVSITPDYDWSIFEWLPLFRATVKPGGFRQQDNIETYSGRTFQTNPVNAPLEVSLKLQRRGHTWGEVQTETTWTLERITASRGSIISEENLMDSIDLENPVGTQTYDYSMALNSEGNAVVTPLAGAIGTASGAAGWNGKVDNLPLFEYDEASGTGYAYTYEVTEIKVGSEPVDPNNPPENYNGQNSDYLVSWTQDPDDPKHWILGNREKQGIDVTVKKVALWDVENSAAVPLEGATFKLEKYTDSTYASKDTSFKDVTIEDKDNETKGLFSFEKLHEGYYKLVETKTPKDFIKTSSDPRFRVKKDSSDKLVVVLIDEEGQEIEGKGSSPVIVENTTITVGNDKGFALPQTGGSGTDLIYLTGILLIGLCGVLLLRRRFRRI